MKVDTTLENEKTVPAQAPPVSTSTVAPVQVSAPVPAEKEKEKVVENKPQEPVESPPKQQQQQSPSGDPHPTQGTIELASKKKEQETKNEEITS